MTKGCIIHPRVPAKIDIRASRRRVTSGIFRIRACIVYIHTRVSVSLREKRATVDNTEV